MSVADVTLGFVVVTAVIDILLILFLYHGPRDVLLKNKSPNVKSLFIGKPPPRHALSPVGRALDTAYKVVFLFFLISLSVLWGVSNV